MTTHTAIWLSAWAAFSGLHASMLLLLSAMAASIIAPYPPKTFDVSDYLLCAAIVLLLGAWALAANKVRAFVSRRITWPTPGKPRAFLFGGIYICALILAVLIGERLATVT